MGAMTTAFALGQIAGPLYATHLVKMTGSFTASLRTASVFMAVSALALYPERIDRQSGRVKEQTDLAKEVFLWSQCICRLYCSI